MPQSTTTFEERLARIKDAQTVDRSRIGGGKKGKGRPLRSRLLTIPSLTGIGILTGLPAYAWASTSPYVVAPLGDLPVNLPMVQELVVALAG